MARILPAAVVLVAALTIICCVVTGFTSPGAVGSSTPSGFSSRGAPTSPTQSPQPWIHQSSNGGLPALQAVGSENDGIEEYKRKMAEFMAQAHEKRLQALEVVKGEVQRGYEQQIADLQSKLAALPASARDGLAAAPLRVQESQLVGAGSPLGSATGNPQQHPSYAARTRRPGWEARWGPEEPVRASTSTIATPVSVSAADVVSMEARVKATSSSGRRTHPAYAARAQRRGWGARWGDEEVSRACGLASSAGGTAGVSGAVSAAAAGATVGATHPAFAARAQRPGWEARWGTEEVARTEGAASSTVPPAQGANVHPAYAARAGRAGWEARWGSEEPARAAAAKTIISTTVAPAAGTAEAAATPTGSHPSYVARAQRPGWESRWGPEEPARIASTVGASTHATPITTAAQTTAGVTPLVDAHPAYAARIGRPGWEVRWGGEEKDRVAGAAAGAIAVAGGTAGFATAGGLDTAAAGGSSSALRSVSKDPLKDELLPEDVGELKDMVVANRRHFQDYMLKSLEASNELKKIKTTLETALTSATTKLADEQRLRESLQESFLEYMSRSGDAGAAGKTRIAELEKETARLAAQAEELQRFTQEYMVKASSDKQKAIEDATAAARAQSAKRLAALQAQVLELQAGR